MLNMIKREFQKTLFFFTYLDKFEDHFFVFRHFPISAGEITVDAERKPINNASI